MNKEQLEQVLHQAFPNALLLSVEEHPDAAQEPPIFGGVLADAAFDDKSEVERFRHFQRALAERLPEQPRPRVRLRLLSRNDFQRLVGRVA